MNKLRNRMVIGASFFFCALNCIIAWIISFVSVTSNDHSIIVLGLIMAIMIPISVIDPRDQMQSNLAALCSIILHFTFNLLVTIIFSYWWLFLVFIPETAVLFILFIWLRSDKRN